MHRNLKQIIEKMRNFTLLFLLLFAALPYSYAAAEEENESTAIRGLVKDAKTGEEIIGATIIVKENYISGAVSGLDGTFVLHVPAEKTTIVCSYVGYKEIELDVETFANPVNIMLIPANYELDELVVYGSQAKNNDNSARNIERNSMNVMNVVSAKAIELSPDMTVAGVVQRISGVTVERNSSGDGQYAILRGMDKRYNYTLVNGVKIPSPDNKNRFVPLDIFPSELLDRLEVTKALTADMEGDAVGGAINMIMKDAPAKRQITANIATGYNALFFNRDFLSFDKGAAQKKSPYELYGAGYNAKAHDFASELLNISSGAPKPNLFAGFSYGDRVLKERLGIMLAGSYQNSYRGSNSLYFDSATASSDASNLPILISKNDRSYSEQQTRYGVHAKFDYRISKNHRLQWYNAYMNFANAQLRTIDKTDLSVGYSPQDGNYNLSFDTRFRVSRQNIISSTLKGDHTFLSNRLKADWSAVFSRAYNEMPDNTSVHTGTTVRNNIQNPISVVTLGGADRRWEHNSDQDWAGYLNLTYNIKAGEADIDLSAGAMFRDKQRTNFFNQYDFRPFDSSKPAGSQNNLIQGVDWNSYDQIKFMVFNPGGSVGNPLNYDASERIAAGYLMGKLSIEKLQIIAGLRAENTNQGYDLKYAIEGVKNIGSQIYTDYLPSINVKYSPIENSNIRASYFKSINRPSFFEIVPYTIINEEFTERGNPDLKHTIAHNVDLRYEYFPRPSEQFMVGLFYKKLKNPIEYGMVFQGQGTFFMPTNYSDAVNYGAEVDVTKYFRSFGVKANYTFTKSTITTTKLINVANPNPLASDKILKEQVEQSRPLNGQAQHVANVSALYKNVKYGWDAQLSFSYTSDRLYAISRYLDNDIWQGSYIQLDASVEKSFKMGLSVFAKASNLLNTPMVLYLKQQNPTNQGVAGYETYRDGTLIRRDYYGQNLQLGVRYKF